MSPETVLIFGSAHAVDSLIVKCVPPGRKGSPLHNITVIQMKRMFNVNEACQQ